jgi:acetyltransferase-like isoleucine patch superfamily enzyme
MIPYPREIKSHGDGSFTPDEFKYLGENVIFEKGVLVFHPRNISLGNHVYIGHYSILKGYYKNEMQIKDNTWVGQNCFFHSAGGLEIGTSVGIGPGVAILTSYHQENDQKIPVMDNDLIFKKVIIEDGCDIGINTTILPGVRVGEGSIIGAGSVVTRDVEPFTVVAGNPAKFLRKRGEK